MNRRELERIGTILNCQVTKKPGPCKFKIRTPKKDDTSKMFEVQKPEESGPHHKSK